jgi:hypothetical protein
MTPDIQILSIVQIAMIGILVVLGMFFMWRKIQRLEQKLEAFAGQLEHLYAAPAPTQDVCPSPYKHYDTNAVQDADADADYDDDADAEEDDLFALNPEEEAIVQRIFNDGAANAAAGGNAAFMVFSPFGYAASPTATPSPPVVQIEEAEGSADAESIATSTRLPSKTKLSKMNVEQLKDYLAQHQLPTDGTRKQLLERALETLQ